MIFWILQGIFIVTLVLASYILKPVYQKNIARFMTVYMIILSGLRYRIGYDYDQYMDLFSWLTYDPDRVWPDPSFQILCELLRYFGFDYQMLFLLYAAVSLVFFYKGLCYFLDNNYRKISLALGIFYLGTISMVGLWFSFTMIRQFAAMAIIFWGTKYILTPNRSFTKFSLCVLFATFFHLSALSILVFYFMPYTLSKKKIFIVIILLPIFIKLTLSLLFTQFMTPLFDRVAGYSLDKVNADAVSLSSYIMTLVMLLFIFFQLRATDTKRNLLIFMTTLGLSLKLFLSGIFGLDRIASEFLIFFYPSFVICIDDIKCKFFLNLGIVFIVLSLFFAMNIRMIAAYPETEVARIMGGSHANIDYKFNFAFRNESWSFYDLLRY